MRATTIQRLISLLTVALIATRSHAASPLVDRQLYKTQASEIMRHIQENFYDTKSGGYIESTSARKAAAMWANGVMFPALCGACRYEPDTYLPVLSRFFKSMDRYWDSKVTPPGYEPYPTNGNGDDKYYDDNEWMVITFCEGYELTHDQKYLQRADQTLKYALTGWDDQLGGGIWWHQGHKGGGKNTCANGPAAVGCFDMAKYLPAAPAKADLAAGINIVDWTTKHLQADDGLFLDNQIVATEKKNGPKLTYNTALMIRAYLGAYRETNQDKYLQQAKRSAKAAEGLLDSKTGAYRDGIKFSHLMVEADLELFRITHEAYLLIRAKNNADHFYAHWKANPPKELIDNASVARLLWLLADTESEVGKKFWAKADSIRK